MCKACAKERAAIYYKKNRNRLFGYSISRLEREKTELIMFIRRMYSFMQSRVYQKRKYYIGIEICNRMDFYKYAIRNWHLKYLYFNWQGSNYQLKMRPVVDRIDGKGGYTLDNIQFVTFSNNSIKSANKKTRPFVKDIFTMFQNGVGRIEIANKFGVKPQSISNFKKSHHFGL